MEDELGQFVPDVYTPPLTRDTGVEVAFVRSFLCGCCGHSMTAHQWIHIEKALERGYQEMECLNSGCRQFRKAAKIPFLTQFFPSI